MPVIPSVAAATFDISTLTLPRYAQLIKYDELAFFGINAISNANRAVRKIWVKSDRDAVTRALGEAQQMIENVLMYPLGQKWFEGERHLNTPRFFTEWGYVNLLGSKKISSIATNIALNHAADPATIAATATSVTDPDEIHFYITGTDDEVYPDTLELAGGMVTASFPRARLVIEAFQNNPATGLPYTETGPSGPFAQAVDIKRIYTDTEDVGEFVWPLGKANCAPECGEDTEPACGYVRSSRSGVVTLLPSNGQTCAGYGASDIRLNYQAGSLPMALEAESAIIHLAHALMAVMPCADSDPLMMLWKQDRFVQEELTQERMDNPFGVQEGAWRAWRYALPNRHFRNSSI